MLDLLPYISEYQERRRRLLWDFVRMLFVKPRDNLLLWHFIGAGGAISEEELSYLIEKLVEKKPC